MVYPRQTTRKSRRSRNNSKNWIVLILVVIFAVIVLIYSNLPVEIPPDTAGSSPSATEQKLPEPTTQAVLSEDVPAITEAAPVKANNVSAILSSFSAMLDQDVQLFDSVAAKKNNEARLLSYRMMLYAKVTNIRAVASLFKDMTDAAGSSAQGVNISSDKDGKFTFSADMNEVSTGHTLEGEFDVQTNSLYYSLSVDNQVERYVEILAVSDGYFMQVFESNSTYGGILYFYVKEKSLQCARDVSGTLDTLNKMYKQTPADWMEFSLNNKTIFEYTDAGIIVSNTTFS